jgi:hypothetical protein
MTGIELVRLLLVGSFGAVQERLTAISDDEWNERAFPGTSKPGFILWHCARILDWTVNSAFQGAPEVVDSAKWRSRFPREACYGAGIPESLADEVAASTSSSEVGEYLAEVKASVMEWFDRQTDATLDGKPPLKANQAARDGYLEPQIYAEVEDLDGLTGWNLLLRPSIAHIRRHMGEYDVLVGALRARAGVATPRA